MIYVTWMIWMTYMICIIYRYIVICPTCGMWSSAWGRKAELTACIVFSQPF